LDPEVERIEKEFRVEGYSLVEELVEDIVSKYLLDDDDIANNQNYIAYLISNNVKTILL
jgi:hypothetical protein